MSHLTSTLKNLNAGRILDVATGGGDFLKFITDTAADYSQGIGIDTKESAAGPFSENFKQNAKMCFMIMSGEKLDFPDSSFDTVCISNSLHHLSNPNQVLQEMLRVLKPGGTFLLSEMYSDGNQAPTQLTHIQFHHWIASIDRGAQIVHNETFTRQQLIDFASALGLTQMETEDQIDLTGDPHDPEISVELLPIIQRYLDRAAGNAELQNQGEKVRERLKTIGFHSASSLLLMAKKG